MYHGVNRHNCERVCKQGQTILNSTSSANWHCSYIWRRFIRTFMVSLAVNSQSNSTCVLGRVNCQPHSNWDTQGPKYIHFQNTEWKGTLADQFKTSVKQHVSEIWRTSCAMKVMTPLFSQQEDNSWQMFAWTVEKWKVAWNFNITTEKLSHVTFELTIVCMSIIAKGYKITWTYSLAL